MSRPFKISFFRLIESFLIQRFIILEEFVKPSAKEYKIDRPTFPYDDDLYSSFRNYWKLLNGSYHTCDYNLYAQDLNSGHCVVKPALAQSLGKRNIF